MTDLMVHRGPSDRGTHVADGIALGVRRLSIVDVAGGHQPVSNEDGTVVAIQNGELYNHRDVRGRLKGHSFLSHCDTEIIPHLYEEHGPRFPEQLRGMFGIAVWDQDARGSCWPVIVLASSRCTTPSPTTCSCSRRSSSRFSRAAWSTLGSIPTPWMRTCRSGTSRRP